ncbi:nuclear transport factor 2 family protein [Aridibaculum aurantiacum]|uniref:nuclear transport factor 2 family protein n=1 Tax=Aridibaculum aurantiacum TaxID=2810307 RepID=UPI001A969CE6|nr:nuclear transport factor 2 family protein [Aridibaculum aurantiacum]
MKISLSLLFVAFSFSAYSQSAEDSVKQVVKNLFAAMKESDSEKMLSTFADSAILQTIAVQQGKVVVKTDAVSAFASSLQRLPKGAADERITFKSINIDGDLASVWTPYQFYYNGKFSHCGVNSFQLVRISGQWKIQYIIDTRRKTNCKED